MDETTEVEQLRAALAARDADLTARDAELAARDADLAAERARVAELQAQVAKLTEAVEQLRELLGRHSGNSNLPPSSDAPGSGKAARRNKGKGRRRGGQPGHRGSHRVLVPPEQIDEVVDLFPSECESCWQALPQIVDLRAKRYQHIELRPLSAHRTEYRRHAVACLDCGYKTREAHDIDRARPAPGAVDRGTESSPPTLAYALVVIVTPSDPPGTFSARARGRW